MNEAAQTITETSAPVKRRSTGSTPTHGHTRNRILTPEYRAWQKMKERCLNPKIRFFSHYGGRGIKICSAWINDFTTFFADVGQKPTPKHSLDRRDNSGHYSCGKCDECNRNGWPSNCRWATRVEQTNNSRANRNITFNGETLTISQWARKAGMKMATLRFRYVTKGWPFERALSSGLENQKVVTMRGVSKNVQDWARSVGMDPKTVYSRLARGWSLEQAISKPVLSKRRKASA